MWWCWIAWQSSMPSYCQITKLWNKYVIPEKITHCKEITSNFLLKHSLEDSSLIQINPITIQWTMVCIISGLVIQRLYHRCAMYCSGWICFPMVNSSNHQMKLFPWKHKFYGPINYHDKYNRWALGTDFQITNSNKSYILAMLGHREFLVVN